MSIQSNINQGLFLGTAALGAIDKMAQEDTKSAKLDYAVSKQHAKTQEEAFDKLGPIPEEALTEEEKLAGEVGDYEMKELQHLKSPSLGDPSNEIDMQRRFKGIIGEKKKADIYQQAAKDFEHDANVYAIANKRVRDAIELKKQQEEAVVKLTNEQQDFVDKIKDPAMKKQAMKQLTGGNR